MKTLIHRIVCTLSLLIFLFSAYTQPLEKGLSQVGDVAPNVKTLDAEYCLFHFNNGLAIVVKGNQQALMDANENFIQPFGKYWYTYGTLDEYKYKKTQDCYDNHDFITPDYGHHYGVFIFFSPESHIIGLLNTKGKVIESVSSKNVFATQIISANDNAVYPGVIDSNLNFTYVTFDGKRSATFKNSRIEISEGLGACTPTGNTPNGIAIYGYKNMKGEFVIPPIYDFASPFSDGVALIGKKDQFGEIKYGYIDHSGKEIIAPSYSIKPTDFIKGVAKVYPKVKGDFDYAFINKKNEIIYKGKENGNSSNSGMFYTGAVVGKNVAFFSNIIIDSIGKVYTPEEILDQVNPNWKSYNALLANYKDGTLMLRNSNNFELYGLIDFRTGVLIPPIFTSISTFDPVSKLAYAKLYLSTDAASGQKKYREGYINEQGLFVMVKGKQTVF